jgi:hypothetical protein
MSKCHVRELSHVYAAIFRDAAEAYPTLGAEFERDLTRLEVAVESRGIRVYLEDLPAIGKHLDRCLSTRQYELSGLPLTKRYSGTVVIPKFLRGLYLLVFDCSGSLKEDCDHQAVCFLRQILYAAKKAVYDAGDDAVRDAVLDFVATDIELPEPESFWDAQGGAGPESSQFYQGFGSSDLIRGRAELLGKLCPQMSTFLTNLDVVSREVTSALGSYDPMQWRFRHGPGAISEVTGPSNKYCWTNWSESLETEYPLADCGFHSHSSWADRVTNGPPIGSEDPWSRLVAVPKTFSGPRLIAAEPSEHQWCQQNSWHYFCSRTRRSWLSLFLDFQDQRRNQELCARGSETGHLATVDLKSASDRVTCHVVGQYFRSNPKLLSCLRASRTRSVKQLLTPKAPELIRLKKFSTMGSANTFPVQSLIFLGIAVAATLTSRGLRPTKENIKSLAGEVAVFGDDIVVPVDSRGVFVDALEVLYFKVNTNKSFWSGNFRESCGVDSFHGVNVTPVYWKRFFDERKPESLASVVETSNNFYMKFLLRTSAYLASTLPRRVPQVAMCSGVGGLKTRTQPVNVGLRTRYNHKLQRVEVEVLTTTSSQTRTATGGDSALLQYFTERPEPTTKWTHGVLQRSRLKTRPRWVCANRITTQ